MSREDYNAVMSMGEAKKPKLGTGKRFAALKGKLAKKGATDPGALAAKIGRDKYGAGKMAKWAAKGRKKG
jgi:hypothetical protein